MAVLYITEYARVAADPNGDLAMSLEPPVAEQTISITGSSTQSNAFNTATKFVRLHTDVVCSVLFGLSPTVTTSSGRMAANQTEYRGVPQGGSFKVAVISNS